MCVRARMLCGCEWVCVCGARTCANVCVRVCVRVRKVDRFTAPYGVADVAFDELLENPFFNVNRPEDLILAEQLISQ